MFIKFHSPLLGKCHNDNNETEHSSQKYTEFNNKIFYNNIWITGRFVSPSIIFVITVVYFTSILIETVPLSNEISITKNIIIIIITSYS